MAEDSELSQFWRKAHAWRRLTIVFALCRPIYGILVLEWTVNSEAARWFFSTWAAPLSAAQLQRWASNMSPQCIKLSLENIGSFADLYISVFNEPPWNDGWSKEVVLERFTSFAQFPTFRGLGCLVDGVPGALVFGWAERWVKGWHFHIREMCVASEHQRQGLGTGLLSTLEAHLFAEGLNRIFLETGESAPAKIFYESCGYRKVSVASLAKRLEASRAN